MKANELIGDYDEAIDVAAAAKRSGSTADSGKKCHVGLSSLSLTHTPSREYKNSTIVGSILGVCQSLLTWSLRDARKNSAETRTGVY